MKVNDRGWVNLSGYEYQLFPFCEMRAPINGHTVIVDGWWMIYKDCHVLKFRGTSWQYNGTEKVTRILRERLHNEQGDIITVRKIPFMYIPPEHYDY